MGKVNLYAPFAGVKDALTLLTLLQDKKKLEETLGIVKVLDDRITELNQAIEVYGKASQIDGLVRAAKEKLALAEQIVTAAQTKAEETLRQARAAIDLGHEALDGRAAAVTAREERMTEAEAAFKTEAEAAGAEMTQRETAADKLEKSAARRLAEGNELKKRYEKALDAMKAGVAAA